MAQAYQEETEQQYADPYQAEYDAQVAEFVTSAAGVYDEPDYGDVAASSPVAEYADYYMDEVEAAEDSLEGAGADAWYESLASEEEAQSDSEAASGDESLSDDVGSDSESYGDEESSDDAETTLFDSEDGGAEYTDTLLNSFYGETYDSESYDTETYDSEMYDTETSEAAQTGEQTQTSSTTQSTTNTQQSTSNSAQTQGVSNTTSNTTSNTENDSTEAPEAEEVTPDPRFAWEPLSFQTSDDSLTNALPSVQNAAANDEDLFSIVPTGTSTFSNVTVTTEAPVVEPTDPKLGTGTKTTNGSEEVTLSQTYTSPTNWVVTESVTKTYSTVENSIDNDGANQDFTREGEETFTVTVISGTTTITTYSITDTFSYESGDVDGITAGSSPASWSVPVEWKDKAETDPAPAAVEVLPAEGATIVADEFTPEPDMTDSDESEVSDESDSFGARYTATVSFIVTIVETLVTLPDGRSGRTTTVSIGSSNSFVSLANGSYSASNSEGTLDDVTIESTMTDGDVVLSVASDPTGNGHSVSSSGNFISYANASTSFNAAVTITVADGDVPADAEPSGFASFSTNAEAGSAAGSSLNAVVQESDGDNFELLTIDAEAESGGSRGFDFSRSATFGTPPSSTPALPPNSSSSNSGSFGSQSGTLIYSAQEQIGDGTNPGDMHDRFTLQQTSSSSGSGSFMFGLSDADGMHLSLETGGASHRVSAVPIRGGSPCMAVRACGCPTKTLPGTSFATGVTLSSVRLIPSASVSRLAMEILDSLVTANPRLPRKVR